MGGITPQNEVPVFRRLNKASRHTFCPIFPMRLAIPSAVSLPRLAALQLTGIANLQEKKPFVICVGQTGVRVKTRWPT